MRVDIPITPTLATSPSSNAPTDTSGVAARVTPGIVNINVTLGSVRALVVSAEDGLDELSLSSRTRVIEVAEGGTSEWYVEPGQFGLAPADLDTVAGGTPEENAAVSRSVLAGEPGPHRDLILLNAAAAIYVGGLAPDLEQGVAKAAEAIDSGAAAEVLERLKAATAAPAV